MSQVPDVKVKDLSVQGDSAPGTAASVEVVVNNRELVTPLLGPAVCGNATGHKTEVTLTVTDASGRTVETETETVCAEGDSIGNEETVQFSPVLDSAGDYSVRASTRVIGKDRDSDTAGPVSLTVSSAGDLGGSAGESDESDGSNRWDWSEDGDSGGGDNPLDFGPDLDGLPSGKVVLGVIALFGIAWLASSTASVAAPVSEGIS